MLARRLHAQGVNTDQWPKHVLLEPECHFLLAGCGEVSIADGSRAFPVPSHKLISGSVPLTQLRPFPSVSETIALVG